MEANKLAEVFNNLRHQGINARIENRNETLLIWATSEGYLPIAHALIGAGANLNAINDDGNTALIRAACENRIDIAKAIIEAGGDLNIQNNSGYTALTLAKRRGNMQIHDLLMAAGADQTLQTKDGITAATTMIGESTKTSITAPRDQALESRIIQTIKQSQIKNEPMTLTNTKTDIDTYTDKVQKL